MPTSTRPKATATSRTRAIQTSISRRRERRGSSVGMSFLDSRHGPLRLLAEKRIVAVHERLRERCVLGPADVAERHERIPSQVARIVARDVETFPVAEQLLVV